MRLSTTPGSTPPCWPSSPNISTSPPSTSSPSKITPSMSLSVSLCFSPNNSFHSHLPEFRMPLSMCACSFHWNSITPTTRISIFGRCAFVLFYSPETHSNSADDPTIRLSFLLARNGCRRHTQVSLRLGSLHLILPVSRRRTVA